MKLTKKKKIYLILIIGNTYSVFAVYSSQIIDDLPVLHRIGEMFEKKRFSFPNNTRSIIIQSKKRKKGKYKKL